MLYFKHLSPWLLIYLIVSVLAFLCTTGTIVIINLNSINGFNFSYYTLLNCSTYSYNKLYTNAETILRICFVFSILSTVFTLGQLIFMIYQFIMFRKFANENDQDQFTPFQSLTIKKLVLLYLFNVGTLLSLIIIFGTYFSFYIELNTCQQQTNYSWSYFIPWIIAATAMLSQLILLIFTLKFFYHFRQEEVNKQKAKEQALSRQQKEMKEMQTVKKRIIESRKNNPNTNQYIEDSTDQQTPRDIETNLLQKMQNDAYNRNSIYDGNQNNSYNQSRIQLDPSLSLTSQQNSLKGQQQKNNNIYQNNNTKGQQEQFNISQMSPNSISAKQKQVMKTLPKHPYKQDKISPQFNRNDVIFQENQLQDGSLDQQYEFKDPKQQSKLQQQTQFIQEHNITFQSPKNQDQQSSIKHSNIQSPNKPKQNLSISDIFVQRYLNSPYLKHLQDKNITPQERRKIKRPYLKLNSGLIQFDSHYDLPNKLSPRNKLKNKLNRNTNNSSQFKNMNGKSQTPKSNVSNSKRLNKSRSTAYYLEKYAKQGKKIQYQNPIQNYVNDDQVHQDKLNKIMDFQKISKRRRRSFASNPFFPFDIKEDPGKLYLHKNKHDGKNIVFQFDEQDEGYDPFKDQTYDQQLASYRGLIADDDGLRNSGSKNIRNDPKKSTSKQIQTPVQTKKSSRKDAQLLDFIRSKHVID